MPSSRRDFLTKAATGGLMFGAIPAFDRLAEFAPLGNPETPGSARADSWDLGWVKKLTAKHKAVMDVAEVDSGNGVWRAGMWAAHYADASGEKPAEFNTVLVLRHHGITLAMKQSFWDKYAIGKSMGATHPLTQKPTDRNPALLSSKRKEQPEQFDGLALDQYLAHGGIALACNVAFGFCVKMVAEHDKVSEEAAKKSAMAALLPGVIMQPSGVSADSRIKNA